MRQWGFVGEPEHHPEPRKHRRKFRTREQHIVQARRPVVCREFDSVLTDSSKLVPESEFDRIAKTLIVVDRDANADESPSGEKGANFSRTGQRAAAEGNN